MSENKIGTSRELEFLETDREITKAVVESSKNDYAMQFKDTAKLREMVRKTQTKPIKKPIKYHISEWYITFIERFKKLIGIE